MEKLQVYCTVYNLKLCVLLISLQPSHLLAQALVLGHHVRRKLVRSLREEYEKMVREIEGGVDGATAHSLTNCTIQWPRKGALCLPVFVEEGDMVTHPEGKAMATHPEGEAMVTHPEGGQFMGGPRGQSSDEFHDEEGGPGFSRPPQVCPYPLPEAGSSSSRSPSPLEVQSLTSDPSLTSLITTASCQKQLTQSESESRQYTQCGATVLSVTTSTRCGLTEVGDDTLNVCNLQTDNENLQSGSPSMPIAEATQHNHSAATEESVLSVSLTSLDSSTSSVLSETSRATSVCHRDEESVSMEAEKSISACQNTTDANPRSKDLRQLHGERLGSVDGGGGGDSDEVLIQELLGSEPLMQQNSLPRDKHSLQELRVQTAMELVWLRQAIMSRQRVSIMQYYSHTCTCTCVGIARYLCSLYRS